MRSRTKSTNGHRRGKTAKKTAATTARSPINGAEIPLGAHPANTGGKKGRSGRKPMAFRVFCADILDDPETQERIRAAAQDPTTPGWVGLIKLLASYAVGPPIPMAEMEGSKEPFRFTLDIGGDGSREC